MKVRDIIKLIEAGGINEKIDRHRFLIVIEKADGNYSAYSPDLPGCVATGATREEVEKNMHEAIEMHVKGLLGCRRSFTSPVPQALQG